MSDRGRIPADVITRGPQAESVSAKDASRLRPSIGAAFSAGEEQAKLVSLGLTFTLSCTICFG